MGIKMDEKASCRQDIALVKIEYLLTHKESERARVCRVSVSVGRGVATSKNQIIALPSESIYIASSKVEGCKRTTGKVTVAKLNLATNVAWQSLLKAIIHKSFPESPSNTPVSDLKISFYSSKHRTQPLN